MKAREILQAMHTDKKAREGKLRFVLSSKIGQARTMEGIPEKTVECILRCAPQFFSKPLASLGNCDA